MTSSIAISDAVSRVHQIQQQLLQLQSGAMLNSVLGGGGGTATGAGATGQSGSSTFSSALAQAQGTSAAGLTGGASTSSPAAAAAESPRTSTTAGPLASGTSAALTGASASPLTSGTSAALTGGVGIVGGTALPPAATGMLTSAQQQFASTLSADTGLNPGVVSAWLLAEESGGAAQSRQAAGNNDWLNVGYTDSGTYGASDAVWSDPVSAANATASWLKGQASIPGYGTASAGVQAVMQTVGQSPEAQIAALQSSGWASSGYPDLGSLYTRVTGS